MPWWSRLAVSKRDSTRSSLRPLAHGSVGCESGGPSPHLKLGTDSGCEGLPFRTASPHLPLHSIAPLDTRLWVGFHRRGIPKDPEELRLSPLEVADHNVLLLVGEGLLVPDPASINAGASVSELVEVHGFGFRLVILGLVDEKDSSRLIWGVVVWVVLELRGRRWWRVGGGVGWRGGGGGGCRNRRRI